MLDTAIYSKAIQIDGRDFDIVISAPGLNGPVQDLKVIQATTELFLRTVAQANGVNRENISVQHLTNTIFQIDAEGRASVTVENEEVSVDNIRNIPQEIQELTGLAGRVSISAQDTISVIRDLQYVHIVHTQVRSDEDRDDSSRRLSTSDYSDVDDKKHDDPNSDDAFRKSIISRFS